MLPWRLLPWFCCLGVALVWCWLVVAGGLLALLGAAWWRCLVVPLGGAAWWCCLVLLGATWCYLVVLGGATWCYLGVGGSTATGVDDEQINEGD